MKKIEFYRPLSLYARAFTLVVELCSGKQSEVTEEIDGHHTRHQARVLTTPIRRPAFAATVWKSSRASRMDHFELLVKSFWRQLPQHDETNRNFNNLAVFPGGIAGPDVLRKKRGYLCYGLSTLGSDRGPAWRAGLASQGW